MPRTAFVHEVATSLGPHRLAQTELRAVAQSILPDSPASHAVLEMFDNSRIDTRNLAMPVPWYLEPHGFKDRTAAFLEVGVAMAERAARAALGKAGIAPKAVRGIVYVNTTGLATPSVDARLANRLGMPPDVARLPLWGLGCAGGVAGLNRAADLALARDGPVLLVALELCSLSFDIERAVGTLDASGKKAILAASLFGDGCAAVVVSPGSGALRYTGGSSHLWPATERVMGWDVEDHNLDVVLSPEIPNIVRARMRGVVDPFVAGREVGAWVLHPGGAKVIAAYGEALALRPDELDVAQTVLRRHGNMSSPTVLFCLAEAMARGQVKPGKGALLAALGPGFAAELAFLESA